jgi:hypothetical protein
MVAGAPMLSPELASAVHSSQGDRMFFELRQYHVRPGQQEKWVKCMEEESETERKRLYDAVYQSDYWKTEIAPRIPTLIDREQIKVTRIVATPRSVIQ